MRSIFLALMVILTGSLLIWGDLSDLDKLGFSILWGLFLVGSQIVGALDSIAHEIRMKH